MDSSYLRSKAAAERFGVSQHTLIRWANAQLIGRARVGGATYYVFSDIEELIARNVAARTVVPITAPAVPPADESWRDYFGLSPSVAAPRPKKRASKRG